MFEVDEAAVIARCRPAVDALISDMFHRLISEGVVPTAVSGFEVVAVLQQCIDVVANGGQPATASGATCVGEAAALVGVQQIVEREFHESIANMVRSAADKSAAQEDYVQHAASAVPVLWRLVRQRAEDLFPTLGPFDDSSSDSDSNACETDEGEDGGEGDVPASPGNVR